MQSQKRKNKEAGSGWRMGASDECVGQTEKGK